MELLASGRDADVYASEPGLVLRRYRRPRDTTREVVAMRYARAAGYPAPEVHSADDRDMILERLDGPTMLADMSARPWTVARHAATLASLHEQLGRIQAPPDLRAFDPASDGTSLLHLDLHPDNVVLTARGPVVIDWCNAGRGDAAIDAAHTWLILATSRVPGSPVARVLSLGRSLFVRLFLKGFDRAELVRWLPVVAEHRLADRNVLDVERERIRGFAVLQGDRLHR